MGSVFYHLTVWMLAVLHTFACICWLLLQARKVNYSACEWHCCCYHSAYRRLQTNLYREIRRCTEANYRLFCSDKITYRSSACTVVHGWCSFSSPISQEKWLLASNLKMSEVYTSETSATLPIPTRCKIPKRRFNINNESPWKHN